MKKIMNWFGFGLRVELEKTRIALGVAREIAEDWRTRAKELQDKVIEVNRDNERLKNENDKLNEQYAIQQRAAAKTQQALFSRVVNVEGKRQ